MIGFFALLLLFQQPAELCTVEGQVIRLGSGEPVPKALVVLRRLDGRDTPYTGSTDAGGKFVLRNVQPGRYRLSAERSGYVRTEYGQRAPERPGTILSLAPLQVPKDLTLRLSPSAVVAGRVLNEDGERLPGAHIALQRFRYYQGKRQLVPVNTATTNDLGEYRIYGIAPGRYYVSAQFTPLWERYGARPADTGETSYVPLYYPNTPEADRAVLLELAPGAELRGIDFSLAPVRTARVRGKVSGPPGGGTSIALMPAESGFIAASNQHTTADAQGNFELRGVAPGNYVIVALRHLEGSNFLNGRLPVQVGAAGVEGIEVPLLPLADVAGSLRGPDGPLPAKPDLRVLFEPREAGTTTGGGVGIVKPDGSFRATRISQGSYQVRVLSLPEDYYVKTVRSGGEDVTDTSLNVGPDGVTGLEVLVAGGGAKVEGAVVNEQQPAADATVVLIPEGARRRLAQYYRQATTDQNGRFTVRGIPPGEYKVFAWDGIEQGAWMDSEFMRTRESGGKALSLKENSTENVALTLAQ